MWRMPAPTWGGTPSGRSSACEQREKQGSTRKGGEGALAQGLGLAQGGEGGGGDPKVWPNKIFPIGNFVFSHDGYFGLEAGGSRGGGGASYGCTAILILPWG